MRERSNWQNIIDVFVQAKWELMNELTFSRNYAKMEWIFDEIVENDEAKKFFLPTYSFEEDKCVLLKD